MKKTITTLVKYMFNRNNAIYLKPTSTFSRRNESGRIYSAIKMQTVSVRTIIASHFLNRNGRASMTHPMMHHISSMTART